MLMNFWIFAEGKSLKSFSTCWKILDYMYALYKVFHVLNPFSGGRRHSCPILGCRTFVQFRWLQRSWKIIFKKNKNHCNSRVLLFLRKKLTRVSLNSAKFFTHSSTLGLIGPTWRDDAMVLTLTILSSRSTWMSSVPPRMKTSFESRWFRTTKSVVFHASSTWDWKAEFSRKILGAYFKNIRLNPSNLNIRTMYIY